VASFAGSQAVITGSIWAGSMLSTFNDDRELFLLPKR
jgi:hypothetical protein